MIKLDREFLLNEGDTGKGAIIAQHHPDGKKLEIQTVAEGVRRPASWPFTQKTRAAI